MDRKNTRTYPPKYNEQTCNMAKQPGSLHLMEAEPATWSWGTGLELALLDTYEQGILEWRLPGTV